MLDRFFWPVIASLFPLSAYGMAVLKVEGRFAGSWWLVSSPVWLPVLAYLILACVIAASYALVIGQQKAGHRHQARSPTKHLGNAILPPGTPNG